MCFGPFEPPPDPRQDNGLADAGGHAVRSCERCRIRDGSRAPAGANGGGRQLSDARPHSAGDGLTAAAARVFLYATDARPVRAFGGSCAVGWRVGAHSIPVRDSPTGRCPERCHPIAPAVASSRHTSAACIPVWRCSCQRGPSPNPAGVVPGAVRPHQWPAQTRNRPAQWRAPAPERACARDAGVRKFDVDAPARASRRTLAEGGWSLRARRRTVPVTLGLALGLWLAAAPVP